MDRDFSPIRLCLSLAFEVGEGGIVSGKSFSYIRQNPQERMCFFLRIVLSQVFILKKYHIYVIFSYIYERDVKI